MPKFQISDSLHITIKIKVRRRGWVRFYLIFSMHTKKPTLG